MEEKDNPKLFKTWFFFRKRPIHFHINSTSVIRLVTQNKLSFSSNEISKLLPATVRDISYRNIELWRVTNYTKQNENGLDSLACVTMLDYDSALVIIYNKSKFEAISDWVTFSISVMTAKTLHYNSLILLKCIKP